IPGGIAVKGVNLARQGVKGVNWFSEAGRLQSAKRIEEAMARGQAGTAAYKAAKAQQYRAGLANMAVDTVAAEIAIVGALNAHPYMEDYLENPASNFAMSLAFGLGIGGAVSWVGSRHLINQATAAAEKKAFDA